MKAAAWVCVISAVVHLAVVLLHPAQASNEAPYPAEAVTTRIMLEIVNNAGMIEKNGERLDKQFQMIQNNLKIITRKYPSKK